MVIFLDLEENQSIYYAWTANPNDNMYDYNRGFFEARTDANEKGLSPFRVTFEKPANPYLILDNINEKICVVDFTHFFN